MAGAWCRSVASPTPSAGFRADPAGTARGCNITVPFKFDAAAVAQHVSSRAALAQAVNLLSFRDDGVHGDNTDGAGLVNDITRNGGVPLQGRDVLLVGAGGGASGVLGPFLEAGARRVVVANRTLGKAVSLVQRHAALALSHHAEIEAQALDTVSGSFDVVVNATASSLSGGARADGGQRTEGTARWPST